MSALREQQDARVRAYTVAPMNAIPQPALPAIEVAFPDLAPYASGNTGIPYVWTFAATVPGPHVLIQALTHGNEVCGAIALDRFLREGLRPLRGTLSLVFANVAAYHRFDPADPFASRCVDEDFNRLWTSEVLDGPRSSVELTRARELRPVYDVIIDGGHVAGKRLRDYAFFDDPQDPRNALLVECGQHWEANAPAVARQAMLRFMRHFGMLDTATLDRELQPLPPQPQRTVEVTATVTITTDAFRFTQPVQGLQTIPRAGTVYAIDGSTQVRTPHDNCVLIMPTRRPKKGETAVRIGRYVN